MHYPQAGLARAQLQPLQLRRNQVHGQHETDQSAAGEYGNRKCRTGNVPEDEEAAHVRVDRGEGAHPYLGERAQNHQHHEERETGDAHLQGCKSVPGTRGKGLSSRRRHGCLPPER